MAYVVLDIGAGSRAFGAALQSANRNIPMLVMCGEPAWGIGPFLKACAPRKISRLLRQGKTGVIRIRSSFGQFELEDESLDLVTLNCPHPFDFLGRPKIHNELSRCLKPGGMFFSSFPMIDVADMSGHFTLIESGGWGEHECLAIDPSLLPASAPYRFPQSLILAHNIHVHRHGDPRSGGSSYIYRDGINPGWNLWQKPS